MGSFIVKLFGAKNLVHYAIDDTHMNQPILTCTYIGKKGTINISLER